VRWKQDNSFTYLSHLIYKCLGYISFLVCICTQSDLANFLCKTKFPAGGLLDLLSAACWFIASLILVPEDGGDILIIQVVLFQKVQKIKLFITTSVRTSNSSGLCILNYIVTCMSVDGVWTLFPHIYYTESAESAIN
jgi:hypothetical protein